MSEHDMDAIFGAEGFDTNSVEPTTGDFEPLPAGWYPVMVDSAEVKETKAGTGLLLAVGLTVMGEKFNNRKLWPRINLKNPSEKAVEIGKRELAGLGQACGLATIKDSTELIGHVIMAKVKVRAEAGREPDNEVVAYKAADGAVKPVAAPAAKPAAAAPAADKPKRPWER